MGKSVLRASIRRRCRSAAVSLKVYTKPTYGPHSYTRELAHMRHEPLPALNTQVFARLHA